MGMLLQCHLIVLQEQCQRQSLVTRPLKEHVRAAHLEGWLHAPGTCGKRVRGC